ncbi:MAG TPA: pantoate--beta-alanine ligase [Candidatus Bipolaricaulota bacterium]
MNVVESVSDVRRIRWQDPRLSWGLAPTLGGLHEGHLSLVRRAKAENDHVGVSLFLNPTQFAPQEDLAKYPSSRKRDLELLEAEGVDLVWAPSVAEVYPPGFQTYVVVEEVTTLLEGASRPTHFRGVTTVVAKILNVFQPTRAYFGQKDAQQMVVLQRMVLDLNFNVQIVVCPTVREPDGLAMSTRNAYLNPAQRQAATVLYRALQAAQAQWKQGVRDAEALCHAMKAVIKKEPLARLDYVSAADPQTLKELQGPVSKALLSLAVYIGSTRLIDNLLLETN